MQASVATYFKTTGTVKAQRMVLNSYQLMKVMLKRVVGIFILVSGILSGSQAYATPQIQTWTTNGAKVLFVPATSIPILDVRITFDAGSARDNGLSGLAVLTNGLLAEGAAGLSSQEIAENFESVGAQFGNDALRDMALVSIRSLVDERYLKPALNTFEKVLTQPDFSETTFQRELNRMKVAVRASEQSPADIASKAFYKAIYGDHPYASPVSGDRESLEKISLQDVRDFYKKYYVASNATITIVGAIERAQAETIARELVQALASGQKAPPLAVPAPLTEAQTIHIEYPSTQSHIYVGQLGVKRGDKDYFALYMANHPFGGSGFSSRLVEVVREEHGLAYSVYSYFSPMRETGPFMMGMQTRNDQVEQALDLLDQELRKYLRDGPDMDELIASKSNITGSFPLNLDSNSKLMGYISMMGFYDMPMDYLEHFIENVRAVELADINDALSRRLDADRMVTVVVGKAATSQDAETQ